MSECKLGTEKCGVVCTGYVGGELWDKMDKVCDEAECSICVDHCHNFVQAERDRIAYHKGKEVHNLANLKEHAEHWGCTGRELGI